LRTSLLYPEIVDPAIAKRTLATLIEQGFDMIRGRKLSSGRRVLRVEVPVEQIELLVWLQSQGDRSRGYWCDREREFELAGVGTADIISAEAECDYHELFARLNAGIAAVHPNLHYYGGMRFDQRCAPAEKWRPFGAYRFVLPRFEVFTRGAQTYLACNAIVDEESGDRMEAVLEQLEAMPFPGDAEPTPLPAILARIDRPDPMGWDGRVGETLDVIARGELEKAVLARETVFEFSSPIDPASLLRRIAEGAQHRYRFCFQPKPGIAFVGVSPERLYKRLDRFIETEALAGTRPRHPDPARDHALGNALLASNKDLREHGCVVRHIEQALARCVHTVHAVPKPSVMRLCECQHLHSPIEAILQSGVTDAEILRVLHPTPAVGGSPVQSAVDWIGRKEGFDRGWYAGPVGWVGHGAAEFAVGIRSALIHYDTLSVYAGAGIVDGSEPDEEWDELESKIGNFLVALSTP
jgi:menaquinone-specific isochorismate synthase